MVSHHFGNLFSHRRPSTGDGLDTKPGEPGYAFLLAPSPASKAAGCTQTRPVERGKAH
jgi:hypothetical protein